MKYVVTLNGNRFAAFDTRQRAEEYADAQRRKQKGGGLWTGELGKMPDARRSFASKQVWSVSESEGAQ